MPQAPKSHRIVLDAVVLIAALRSQGGASFGLLQFVAIRAGA
jgi:predicted nucleic acid-binding protein